MKESSQPCIGASTGKTDHLVTKNLIHEFATSLNLDTSMPYDPTQHP